MHRPPPRRPGSPGSAPQRGGPPSRGGPPGGRGGPPPGHGGPPRGPAAPTRKPTPAPDRPDPRKPEGRRAESQDAEPAGPRQRGAAPAPRGRDRRGMGDPSPRMQRAAEAPAPARGPRVAIDKEATPPGSLWIHGLHAVAAALANPRRRAKRLLVTPEALAELVKRVPRPWRVQPEPADRHRFLTFLPEDSVHQGAALLVEPLTPLELDQAIARSDGPVLLLDQVTDPRNVGAILRSAAAFGAACVVMQDRNAPPETGALARAASGALEIVPIAREVNLSRAIVSLQKAGFWVLGLAGEATRTIAEATPRDRRVALVLGAEDAGMRRLQRETCDELVRLPIAAGMESLNVSAAAAVALYELARGEPSSPAEAPEQEDEEETEE